MTEDEARTKWCPFARVVMTRDLDGRPLVAATMNQTEDDDGAFVGTLCIASRCMAFRWAGTAYWDGDTSGRTPEETGAKTVRNGYCGLAGKP